jgi:drug/metabolite transporter (DMT)-like permease
MLERRVSIFFRRYRVRDSLPAFASRVLLQCPARFRTGIVGRRIIIKYVELSVSYPFIALGFVLVGLLFWVFLHEVMSILRLLVMILITSGVVCVVRS